jgi:hypothetical protein
LPPWNFVTLRPKTEDSDDLVRLPDRTVGVEEAFTELVERGATVEDEIVAKLDLGEEQSVLVAGILLKIK